MKLFSEYTHICFCPNCNIDLHYRPYEHNIYDGGPYYCGNCHVNVTEAIYGKPKDKNIELVENQ